LGITERKNSKWGGSITSSDSDEEWQNLKNPPNREAVSHPVIQIRNGRIWKPPNGEAVSHPVISAPKHKAVNDVHILATHYHTRLPSF
jgi:hypothetical protein